ncbi:DNA/RNA non-specific endonuclease [Schleiferiaceae bacterium]|jgi:endonuclease G|nr:DNA/RNA non-specific endonuclease [Schleiferiaceae bacterium]
MSRLLFVFNLFCLAVSSQDLKPLGLYNDIVSHEYYTLSYSEAHEQAEWVYYTLNCNQLKSDVERKDNFRADHKIKTLSAQLSDYRGSGYDRGHLAPAADMKYNSNSMSESFFMSNMSPQAPSFNRGVWRRIEKQFRDWGYRYGELVIVTGPVLKGKNYGSIGFNKVTIPQWYYKVAIDPDNYQRNIAILIENKGSTKSIRDFVVTIDYLEEVTGIDFFYNLADEVQGSFESSTHPSLWEWNATTASKSSVNKISSEAIERAPSYHPDNGGIYRTKTGKKYHRESCRYLSKGKISITLSEAKDKGLGPCGVCKP